MALNLYSQYSPRANAPDSNYAYGSAKNVTVPNDGTGTPWEKSWIDDTEGLKQRLLVSAGITPSGNPDTVLVSQYHDAIRLTAGYPGLITPLALNVSPASLGLRILLLDGSGVLVATYPDLVAATYVGDTANPTAGAFYRADDSAGTARNTTGNYLILPDARGRFPRGLDTSGTVDPDGASRELGDEQLDAVQRHNHIVQSTVTQYLDFEERPTGSGTFGTVLTTNKTEGSYNASEVHIGEDITGFPVTGVGRVDSETRPANFAVNWGIWY